MENKSSLDIVVIKDICERWKYLEKERQSCANNFTDSARKL